MNHENMYSITKDKLKLRKVKSKNLFNNNNAAIRNIYTLCSRATLCTEGIVIESCVELKCTFSDGIGRSLISFFNHFLHLGPENGYITIHYNKPLIINNYYVLH